MSVEFERYIKAGYAVIYVQTHEELRAIKSLGESDFIKKKYNIYSWDIVSGLFNHKTKTTEPMEDPTAPLTTLANILPHNSILFLKDYHKYIESLEVYRNIKNIIPELKSSEKHIVMVSPVMKIPIEVEKDIVVHSFELPSIDEIIELAKKIIVGNQLKNVDINVNALKQASGLTLQEVEDVISLSLVSTGRLDRDIINHEKLQAIKRSGLMEIYEPVTESQLGGLRRLKEYLRNRKRGFEEDGIPTPKGILLLGPPGAGKSLSAKVTASVLDVPLVKLDIGILKNALVGSSEQNLRMALNIIDAISPCVVWIDEIEKHLGGAKSSNMTDGGTTNNMFGYLLTWMQESTKSKYIVATCNDIKDILTISQGALIRRFDDIFFIDIPSHIERKSILEIMNKRYNTKITTEYTSKMINWTGSEIEKFIIASIYDGVESSFENIKPVYNQNKEVIEEARIWAKLNARFANEPEETDSTNLKTMPFRVINTKEGAA